MGFECDGRIFYFFYYVTFFYEDGIPAQDPLNINQALTNQYSHISEVNPRKHLTNLVLENTMDEIDYRMAPRGRVAGVMSND